MKFNTQNVQETM